MHKSTSLVHTCIYNECIQAKVHVCIHYRTKVRIFHVHIRITSKSAWMHKSASLVHTCIYNARIQAKVHICTHYRTNVRIFHVNIKITSKVHECTKVWMHKSASSVHTCIYNECIQAKVLICIHYRTKVRIFYVNIRITIRSAWMHKSAS